MSEKAPDKDVYPTCLGHHLTGVGCVAVHKDPEKFHRLYGSDDHLTKLTRIGVQRMLDGTIGKRA